MSLRAEDAVLAAATQSGTADDDELRLHLRWLADTYERVQRVRIDCGERMRAVAQGRASGATVSAIGADRLLADIRAGRTDGPVPVLGATYRLHCAEEQRLRAAMGDALTAHPAWPWLRRVRGIGPTLATKLLARLDLARAPTPSSFWAYCGLATVPAREWRCADCGAVRVLPVARQPARDHRHADGTPCDGRLALRPAATSVRVAPPPPRRGETAAFDRSARRVCYQIGVALLRAGGPYAEYYRHERRSIMHSARDWTRAHAHMAALRKMQKLLLAHLWVEWAREVGAATTLPYAHTRLLRPHYIAPADMVGT